MKNLRCVHIGNFALPQKKHVYSLKSYAKFYNELAHNQGKVQVSVFAGYIRPGETGFDFSFEEKLSDTIQFTLPKGNTPDSKLFSFLWNNFRLLFPLFSFCLKKGDYFIFLPSPYGIISVLLVTLFQRKKSLGIYIGGYYGREQAFEKRKGNIKRRMKKFSAVLVDRLINYAILKADYVITSSYEYHYNHSSLQKVHLTPPLINVDECDLTRSLEKCNKNLITFCGELRHAKGVIDLMHAFIQLVKENGETNCKLKFIGSGQAHEELLQLAAANGIAEKVIFCGQIKDEKKLKEEIGSSAVFVLPSYSEGFPRVAYEAFTLGVPAILTPVGGIPFFVKHNEHCLLVQPGNKGELVSAISSLLNDNSLHSKLQLNARLLMANSVFPRIQQHGSLAKMVERMINKVK